MHPRETGMRQAWADRLKKASPRSHRERGGGKRRRFGENFSV